jgi:hypothetical protein
VPVVLRKAEDLSENSNLYELVGEAYVHRKMDGEAVDNQSLVDRLSQNFELK